MSERARDSYGRNVGRELLPLGLRGIWFRPFIEPARTSRSASYLVARCMKEGIVGGEGAGSRGFASTRRSKSRDPLTFYGESARGDIDYPMLADVERA